MTQQIEQLKNNFELKMEEAKADARFLAWYEKSPIDKELNEKEWKEYLKTLSPKDREKHKNLKIFLDATEYNPARQGKTRQERAQMRREKTYNEEYRWPIPKYEK